jgi:murein DD-endopeptidase MepM/ murein hydrolase activator NlpD
MYSTIIRRVERVLVATALLLGTTACTGPGAPGSFDNFVAALREANATTHGQAAADAAAPASPAAVPADDGAKVVVAADPALPVVQPVAARPVAQPVASQPVATQKVSAPVPAAKAVARPAEAAPDLATLQHQLDALEGRVAALTAQNERQMEQLSTLTNGAIADMEQLFNSLRLELRSTPGSEPTSPLKRRRTPTAGQAGTNGQGGPFLPWPPKPSAFSPTGKVEPLLPDLKSLFLLHQVVRSLPLSAPLDEAVVTGPFGFRKDPFNRRSAFHDGIDLQAPMRTPVYAAGAGTVVAAGMRPAYGRVIEIDHGFGIHTRYAHLSALNVREGDHIERHTLIGALGSSGRSASPHLHYEVLFNGRPHDPADLLVLAQGIRSLR